MKQILAIAVKTIRSAIRTKVVHVLLFISFLTVFVLPMTLAHDGTGKGLIQVSLTYTLGIIGVLLSLVAVWLGCSLVAQDIEGYQIHMVITKPVSRLTVWFGKWLGVIGLLSGILLINAICIYGICMFRLHRAEFSQAEMQVLEREVLTARQVYEVNDIDYDKWAKLELRNRRRSGMQQPGVMGDADVLEMIRPQLERRVDDIPFNSTRLWRFTGLPTDDRNGIAYLRYKYFLGSKTSKDQRVTQGIWLFENPNAQDEQQKWVGLGVQYMAGDKQELRIDRNFIADDGTLTMAYLNADPEQETLVISTAELPRLMIGARSFINNYARVVFLLFVQIILMATIGCAAGAAASAPVAIFLSFSYVAFGLIVRYMKATDYNVGKQADSVLLTIADTVGDVIRASTVSLNGFVRIGSLIDGVLIDIHTLVITILLVLVLRGGVIATIGLLTFQKRELGLIMRK